ncbi:MAG TPA: universal stress protein [Gallionella sp.]|nr:universal stress protein [Gallionella sp.]
MKILVAVDLADATEKVVNKVEELAPLLSAAVWLLHVAEPEPDFVGLDVGPQHVRDALSNVFHHEHVQIQQIAERLRSRGIDTTALLVQGATAEGILQEAAKLQVDMIVLGSHGSGAVRQIVLGSVSAGVLQKSACPVLLVPIR